MTTRFDDSLPALAEVVAGSLGEGALAGGVALRDTTGRLAFVTRMELGEELEERVSVLLRQALGPYARTDRVLACAGDPGADTLLNDEHTLLVRAGTHSVRLLDRRIVGADWLRAPADAVAAPPRFVFASLKGGVGRSTALAVVAAHRASRGGRVLVVDLDIEAPGLGAMLLDGETLPQLGMLDALVESALAPLDDLFIADLVGPSALADQRGKIDVIPAYGRRSLDHPADVLSKIARAYTETLRPDGTVATLLDHVRTIVDRLADPTRYDIVLVDARAGLHETTASAILGLGAEVLLFGLDEPQTFAGYSALLAHLSRFIRPGEDAPEWLDRLTMVQGKAPADAGRRRAFEERCQALFEATGLGPRTLAPRRDVPLPAGSFHDVPWDDEVPDDDVLPDEAWRRRKPLAILNDGEFVGFDPLTRRDLLAEHLYRSAFGELLDAVDAAFATDPRAGT